MKEKKINCYEVEVKALVRNECSKKELKKEVEDCMADMSYTLENCEVKIK